MSRSRVGLLFGAGFLFLLGLTATLNVTGFCYAELRYYSDQDFIDNAARATVKWHHDSDPDTEIYDSLDEFYKLNPNCCVLRRWSDPFANDFRLLGFYVAVAEISYKAKNQGLEPFYSSYVSMNACGKVVKRRGISKDHAHVDSAIGG